MACSLGPVDLVITISINICGKIIQVYTFPLKQLQVQGVAYLQEWPIAR